jgi:tRNA(Ile)-lysidine synthase TilS/MesJ
VVLFSGGKDSVAVAKLCKEKYKKVYLYHVKGLNRAYPSEYENAEKIAEYLDLPLIIDQVKYSGKNEYRISPLKNQITGALALNYCIQHNIPSVIAVGDV